MLEASQLLEHFFDILGKWNMAWSWTEFYAMGDITWDVSNRRRGSFANKKSACRRVFIQYAKESI